MLNENPEHRKFVPKIVTKKNKMIVAKGDKSLFPAFFMNDCLHYTLYDILKRERKLNADKK